MRSWTFTAFRSEFRSEYTSTLLLPAELGGEFDYHRGPRAKDDPKSDGVTRALQREDSEATVRGAHNRLIAVSSYCNRPGVLLSERERLGFYGRSE
jgi:hypothetical protein